MGRIYRLSCKVCGYEDDLKIGAGLMSIREKVLETLLEKADLEEWKKLKNDNKVMFFAWEFNPAYCDKCNELKACVSVKIITNDNEKLYLGCRCKECQRQLEALDIGSDIKCTSCKSVLQKAIVGNWD